MQQQQPQQGGQYGGMQPNHMPNQSPQTAGLVMPANLAAMAQQGYAQQRARLAAMQQQQQQGQGGPSTPQQQRTSVQQQPGQQGGMPAQWMIQQAQAQAQAQAMGMQGMQGGPGGMMVPGMQNAQAMQAMQGMQGIQANPAMQAMQYQMALAARQGIAGPQGLPMGRPPMTASMGMPHHQHSNSHKKKKHRPTPAQQMIPPHRPPPSFPAEAYRQQAMAAPSLPHLPTAPPPHGPPTGAAGAAGPGAAGPVIAEVEPWGDMVDEIDPRELAMARFRARQEILSDIFGPEPIKSIPLFKGDAWSGFGLDGETLEAKVAKLEAENESLEKATDTRSSNWLEKLKGIDEGTVVIDDGFGRPQPLPMEVEAA